jgi:hypothetical protein
MLEGRMPQLDSLAGLVDALTRRVVRIEQGGGGGGTASPAPAADAPASRSVGAVSASPLGIGG